MSYVLRRVLQRSNTATAGSGASSGGGLLSPLLRRPRVVRMDGGSAMRAATAIRAVPTTGAASISRWMRRHPFSTSAVVNHSSGNSQTCPCGGDHPYDPHAPDSIDSTQPPAHNSYPSVTALPSTAATGNAGSAAAAVAPITAASPIRVPGFTAPKSRLQRPGNGASVRSLVTSAVMRDDAYKAADDCPPDVSPNDLSDLVANNVKWADRMVEEDPLFFKRLENVQAPQYLWLGCSDSRVPANTIIGKLPGEVFVHRNIANCVVHADLNMLSVLQFAVDVLKVRHVIVCGHYGCGGVIAAMKDKQYGVVDNWIRYVREVYHNHQTQIDSAPPHKRADLLCEEHARAQTANVCRTTIVQNAWARGQPLSVNGFIYRLSDGKLVRLVDPITCSADSRLSAKFRVVPRPGTPKAAAAAAPSGPSFSPTIGGGFSAF